MHHTKLLDFLIENYQITAGTTGGVIITIMNFTELHENLISRILIACCCTICSFLTSVALKYTIDKISRKNNKKNDDV